MDISFSPLPHQHAAHLCCESLWVQQRMLLGPENFAACGLWVLEGDGAQIPALPLFSCVMLTKLLNLSVYV